MDLETQKEMKAPTQNEEGQLDTSYLKSRDQLKYNSFQTVLLIIKSTVGCSLFSYEYSLSRVGFILGSILSITVSCFSTYAIYRLLRIADLLEQRDSHLGPDTDYEVVSGSELESSVESPSNGIDTTPIILGLEDSHRLVEITNFQGKPLSNFPFFYLQIFL